MQFNILDFGAVPDGCTDATGAIQQAIDQCSANGGGRVVIPAGTFACDMITLKDNIEFHMEQGSRINSLLKPVPDPNAKCEEPSSNPHRWLIGGVKLKNVSITGFGVIDGRAEINFWNKNDGLEHPLYGQRFWPRRHRPKGMIHFRESTGIIVRDVTLIDPPCYCLWFLGCDICEVSGIRINADLRGPNDDGIDMDCCSNVRISDCDIVCGDDGIALKSDIHELGYDKACENITITNCRIHTTSDGIRLGYEGDGAIRRVTVSNCVIHDTMIGISLMVAISPNDERGIDIYKGPEITDIVFDNLVIDAFQTFNFQHPKSPEDCPEPVKGFLDRIFFRNITATATRGSFLGGVPESPIRHIEFSNLHMTLSGHMGEDFLAAVPDPYPVWTDLPFSGVPWPFYVRNAQSVVLRDSSIVWENAEGSWQPEIVKCENADVTVERVKKVNSPVFSEKNGDVIFPIGMNNGIPYFMPPVGFDESRNLTQLISINDANTDEINNILPELMPTKAHINASFIYGQPPDYYGMPMLNASVDAWKKVFRRFQGMRIDTVIFQAALWRELGQCFYRSKNFAELNCYGVLERMFTAAEEENMRVFLGGYGSVTGWKEHFTKAELTAELKYHRCCFEELYQIGKISGMYFPAETAFDGYRLPEKEQRMRTLYRNFSDMVKSKDSSLKIIASPATMHTLDKNDMFKDYWNSVLDSCNIDILMPQDCIGNTCSRLSRLNEQWKAWKEIADSHKIDLWSHIEIFERRGYSPDCDLYPAPPERVAAQLALTAPYVSGYCCWEALYFTSDEAGMEGKKLRQFLASGNL
jgi:hypothetical protein